jgi:integrase
MKRTRYRGIKEIEKGKYLINVKARNPRLGKIQRQQVTFLGTLEQANAERLRLLADIRAGSVEGLRMTLGAFVKSWLERKVPTLSEATAQKYAIDLTLHILPVLGDFFLDALRPSDVQKFVNQDAAAHAGWSVRNRLTLLRQIAKDAIADDLIVRDFCARVRAPEGADYDEENPNKLTASQLDSLLRHFLEHEPAWYTLVLAIASTGMRWGEVSALRWEDIDEVAAEIRIRRRNWKGEIGDCKTKKSRRNVPLEPELAERLRELRRVMVERQDPALAGGWIFPVMKGPRRGQPQRGTPLRNVLVRALRDSELGVELTTHGLRRTFNDLCRRVADRQVAKAIMGHTTDRMHEHYSLPDRNEKREAQAKVLRLVRSSQKAE